MPLHGTLGSIDGRETEHNTTSFSPSETRCCTMFLGPFCKMSGGHCGGFAALFIISPGVLHMVLSFRLSFTASDGAGADFSHFLSIIMLIMLGTRPSRLSLRSIESLFDAKLCLDRCQKGVRAPEVLPSRAIFAFYELAHRTIQACFVNAIGWTFFLRSLSYRASNLASMQWVALNSHTRRSAPPPACASSIWMPLMATSITN